MSRAALSVAPQAPATEALGLTYRRVQVRIPSKLVRLTEHWRFKIIHGGRGSAKSHSVAQLILERCHRESLRVLCVREVQQSIAESSMQVLKDYIERLGMSAFWDTQEKLLRHKITGSVIKFVGMKDHSSDAVKSREGINLIWIEEAHSVSAESWIKLIPTIMRVTGAEIWATFNPDSEDDYVYNRFVKNTDPDALVIEMNWRDNPWFNEEMNSERLKDKAANDDLYNHVWEGKCRTISGKIFKRRWFKYYRPSEKPEGLRMYGASDYAVTPDGGDWTEHGLAGLDNGGNLFVTDWWSGQVDPEEWVKALVGIMGRGKPVRWFEEKGVILRSVTGVIAKRMRRMRIFVHRVGIAPAGTKADRSLGFAAMCSAGIVYLPKNEDGSDIPWVVRLVNQLCAFSGLPTDTDDMVDVCSLFARGMDMMFEALEEPEQREEVELKVGSRQHLEPRYQDPDRERQERQRHYR